MKLSIHWVNAHILDFFPFSTKIAGEETEKISATGESSSWSSSDLLDWKYKFFIVTSLLFLLTLIVSLVALPKPGSLNPYFTGEYPVRGSGSDSYSYCGCFFVYTYIILLLNNCDLNKIQNWTFTSFLKYILCTCTYYYNTTVLLYGGKKIFMEILHILYRPAGGEVLYLF